MDRYNLLVAWSSTGSGMMIARVCLAGNPFCSCPSIKNGTFSILSFGTAFHLVPLPLVSFLLQITFQSLVFCVCYSASFVSLFYSGLALFSSNSSPKRNANLSSPPLLPMFWPVFNFIFLALSKPHQRYFQIVFYLPSPVPLILLLFSIPKLSIRSDLRNAILEEAFLWKIEGSCDPVRKFAGTAWEKVTQHKACRIIHLMSISLLLSLSCKPWRKSWLDKFAKFCAFQSQLLYTLRKTSTNITCFVVCSWKPS